MTSDTTEIQKEDALTAPPVISALPDSNIAVYLIAGSELNPGRAMFETIVATGRSPATLERSLATPTASPGYWCVSAPVNARAPLDQSVSAITAESIALACGLIIGKYVPDDWACGLLIEEGGRLYLTCFTGRGLLGRVALPETLSFDSEPKQIVTTLETALSAGALKTLPAKSAGGAGNGLDALYLADESSTAKIQSLVEYPVEKLPKSRGELIGRGLSFLSELPGER